MFLLIYLIVFDKRVYRLKFTNVTHFKLIVNHVHEIPVSNIRHILFYVFLFYISIYLIVVICSSNFRRSSLSMSSSLSDLVGSPLEISVDVLTIEELRQHMGSCMTCGVSWTDDHVSLDCSECGGYSIERPCPLCDGKCGVQWKRDFKMVYLICLVHTFLTIN